MKNLESVVEEKDLDLVLEFREKNLKYGAQCQQAAAKAMSVLGMIKRSFPIIEELFLILYGVYVSLNLEYCVQVWAPYFQKDIEALEKVQQRATKLVKSIKNWSYEEWLTYLGLFSLERRRDNQLEDDYALLRLYFEGHRSTQGHRFVRDCQPIHFGNLTYEQRVSHHTDDLDQNLVELHHFARRFGDVDESRFILGHHAVIREPARTLWVLEPRGEDGSCERHVRETVTETARLNECILAVNAGFFIVSDGACLGNVVSGGRVAHDSLGVQNAHFGIRKDGSLFIGYISESEMMKHNFQHLVGGVIWLVRNGEVYVNVSRTAECQETQLTGSLQTFIDVLSARTAVGYDSLGRVVIVQVDGKTNERGMNLYEFAELLISLGVVNAVNLDGGGSATMVVNGSLVNYPSDKVSIDGIAFSTEREVSTVLCVRDILCEPRDCSGHGVCYRGNCRCSANWHGPRCDTLKCGTENCTRHGSCTNDGCRCFAGWQGVNCSEQCTPGRYGAACAGLCQCSLRSTGCSPVDGRCFCTPGYRGFNCEADCPLGTYGINCSRTCQCPNKCYCDRITGDCNAVNDTYLQDGQCMGEYTVINRQTAVLTDHEFWWGVTGLIVFSAVAFVSLLLNVYLLCRQTKCTFSQKSLSRNYRMLPARGSHIVYNGSPLMDDISTSELDSDEEYYRKTFMPSRSLDKAERTDCRRESGDQRPRPVEDHCGEENGRVSPSAGVVIVSGGETFPMVPL